MMIDDCIKIAKTMKKPYVYITPQYILGTDKTFSTLSMINNVNLYEYTHHHNIALDISSKVIFYTQNDINFINRNRLRLFTDGLYYDSWVDGDLTHRILSLANRVFTMTKSVNPLHIDEISRFQNPDFKMKLADGHQWMYLNDSGEVYKYLMSNFSSIHPVNASDKVTVDIYDLNEYFFLCSFNIDKKKHIVNEYIKFRKL